MVVYNLTEESGYYVDNRLMKHWEKNSLEIMKKTNSDKFYVVDGRERIGKSTWAFQQAGVLDKEMFSSPEEFVSRICFTPEEFFKASTTLVNKVIIFDEAFRGLSSRGAMSKVNKKIIQVLQEMGQNNNIVFLILPAFFMLDIYPAMLRSNGLFNIKFDKYTKKRVWRGYNYKDKNMIYQIGMKKGWSYPIPCRFKGNFYSKFPAGEAFEQAYLSKKRKSLREMGNVFAEPEDKTYKVEEIVLNAYKSNNSYRKTAEFIKKKYNMPISHMMVSVIVKRLMEKALLSKL